MNLEMALVIRCPLILTFNMKGHLVTLVEIHVHLNFGHFWTYLSGIYKKKR